MGYDIKWGVCERVWVSRCLSSPSVSGILSLLLLHRSLSLRSPGPASLSDSLSLSLRGSPLSPSVPPSLPPSLSPSLPGPPSLAGRACSPSLWHSLSYSLSFFESLSGSPARGQVRLSLSPDSLSLTELKLIRFQARPAALRGSQSSFRPGSLQLEVPFRSLATVMSD